MTPSGATPNVRIYSANGLYDPDVTGIGHQPRGFDQIKTMYDHYYVRQSKITVDFSNLDGVYAMTCGVALIDNNTQHTSMADYAEGANCKFIRLSPSGGSKTTGTVTLTCDTARFTGRGKNSDSMTSACTGMPSEGVYFHIFVDNDAGATSGGGVSMRPVIDYVTKFLECKVPPES